MTERPKSSDRSLVWDLFYPAILGTFLFNLLPEIVNIFKGEGSVDWLKLSISGLIVIHFLLDYNYASQIYPTRTSSPIDVLIIGALFVANNAVNLGRDDSIETTVVSGGLCAAYVLFVLWEFSVRRSLGFHRDLFMYEVIAAIWFFVGCVAWHSNWFILVGLAMFSIAMVVIGGRITRNYRRGQLGNVS